ncbi:MAG TPA: formylglycine-generating enzyme family protein, partial [Pirellulaceae bacterium]|nr:formylglycine-generating enzyme family protein [Pirellulaceae bacterium]
MTLGAVIDHVDSTVRRWVKEENQVRMPQSLPSNQTPAYHGPVHTRSLPLARKAGDLRALAAAVERLPADAEPTGALRLQLVDLLRKADPQGDADRTLISRTSAFVNRKLEGDLFIDFLRGELQRRKLRPSDAPLSSKPSVGVPGMNAAARPFEPFENSIGMRFTYVPPGRFRMGSPPDEVDRGEDEDQVEVAAVAGFHLGVFEVTSREFAAVMGGPPGKDGAGKIAPAPPMDATETANLPASSVSWDMAVEFCRKLSEAAAEKAAGRRYRLPREVEWEYACRAGTKTPFSCGSDLSSEFAWFSGARQRRDRPRAVGVGKPNAWGLYDMHGNVREWCEDRYSSLLEATLPSLPTVAPTDQLPAREPIERVLRGGSWFNSQADCRSAARLSEKPGKRT